MNLSMELKMSDNGIELKSSFKSSTIDQIKSNAKKQGDNKIKIIDFVGGIYIVFDGSDPLFDGTDECNAIMINQGSKEIYFTPKFMQSHNVDQVAALLCDKKGDTPSDGAFDVIHFLSMPEEWRDGLLNNYHQKVPAPAI